MRLLLPFLCLVFATSAHADEPGLFDGLASACWTAVVDNQGNRDTHCYSTAVGGKLAMDVHKVRNPRGVVIYEGVTVYRPIKDGWLYEYSNSFGNLLTGRARRSGSQLQFWTKEGGAEPDTFWKLGRDSYEVTSTAGGAGRVFERSGKEMGGL